MLSFTTKSYPPLSENVTTSEIPKHTESIDTVGVSACSKRDQTKGILLSEVMILSSVNVFRCVAHKFCSAGRCVRLFNLWCRKSIKGELSQLRVVQRLEHQQLCHQKPSYESIDSGFSRMDRWTGMNSHFNLLGLQDNISHNPLQH